VSESAKEKDPAVLGAPDGSEDQRSGYGRKRESRMRTKGEKAKEVEREKRPARRPDQPKPGLGVGPQNKDAKKYRESEGLTKKGW